jgi:putative FmdB family regulatory protein
MPIYEYRCLSCGRRLERVQKFSDKPLSVCPECGGALNKLISSTSFVLKGSGWYSDGYGSTGPEKEVAPKKEVGAPDKETAAAEKKPSESRAGAGEKNTQE